jgi:kynurenine formamidase
MTTKRCGAGAFVLVLVGCGTGPDGAPATDDQGSTSASLAAAPAAEKMLEMTYVYDASAIYWPDATGFRLEKGTWGQTAGGYWYASNEYSAAEHGGTHLDAPIHFSEGGRTIDQIPAAELIGPAVRVDVTSECEEDRDYLLQVADIDRWEREHGPVPRGAWVIMYTGIGTRHYPDPKGVLGTDIEGPQAIQHLSFPGFSPEVVSWLIENREIAGVAIDTPSIDYGRSTDFKAHRILSAADKPGLENIANLDKLPDAGAILYVMPMLIRDGTGAPARVFAVLP